MSQHDELVRLAIERFYEEVYLDAIALDSGIAEFLKRVLARPWIAKEKPKYTVPVRTAKHACRQEKRFKASTLERRKSMKSREGLHELTFVHLLPPGGVARYETSYFLPN
jgi:hypothetical protein